MGFLPSTVAAMASGATVFFSVLQNFDFAEEPVRLWDGWGDLAAGGETWKGMGDLVTTSDLDFGTVDAAESVTFTLSGVSPALVALARQTNQANPVRGRDVTIYGQFFDDRLQPLDSMFVLAQLVMDVLTYAASGPSTRSISLTAESIWTNRNSAAWAYFTDRDQQERFPGDRGLERMVLMTGTRRVVWPGH